MPDYNPQEPRVVGAKQYEFFGGVSDPTIAQLQLDLTAQIEFWEHDLKGEYLKVTFDEEGNKNMSWEQSGIRRVNDNGVRYVVSLLHEYLNVNTFMSVTSSQQINAIMSRFHRRLAGLLIENRRNFAIRSSDDIKDMVGGITDAVWLALLRSKGGETLKAFTKTHSVSEMRETKQERKKFLGVF